MASRRKAKDYARCKGIGHRWSDFAGDLTYYGVRQSTLKANHMSFQCDECYMIKIMKASGEVWKLRYLNRPEDYAFVTLESKHDWKTAYYNAVRRNGSK